ncbi:MAG: DUF1538 domain-containing protein [Oscillospiraceae bacterium]|nr:DUF1538 domain-containing protein [Oscillospiraceae bacterium]
MHRLKEIIREKMSESVKAVLPIIAIIVVLSFTIAPLPSAVLLSFLVGAVLLIAGMSLFNLGAETAMIPMGDEIGSFITKSRRLSVMIPISLLIGILITVAEPDLQVLANQVPTVPDAVLTISVAVGVGLFLVISLLRMLFSIALPHILLVCYALVFGLMAFVPKDFIAIAFDSGGVTTGPMTVPFIMAMGVGIASIRRDKHAAADSFGLVGLSSIGPVISVLILGLLYRPDGSDYVAPVIAQITDSREMWLQFTDISGGFAFYCKDTLLALGPIVLFFGVFQILGRRLNKRRLIRILAGIVYTYVGLVLFLTGVNVGFMPAGHLIGRSLAELANPWILIPISMVIGYFIVAAEPAVHVLKAQIEEISSGAISSKAVNISLSVGVMIALALAMVRLLTHLSILWFLIPGYAIAILLAFRTPKIFTAIAFDSGGVVSGPMATTFLLPLAIGVCSALGGDIVTEAFGVVAMIAMTPLLTIQIMGFIYKLRTGKGEENENLLDIPVDDVEIIE